MSSRREVPWRVRLVISVGFGQLAAFITYMHAVMDPDARDVALILRGTRAVLDGQDPYLVIPGLTYPLPGLLAMLPWGIAPEPTSSVVFMFASAAVFAWALMANGYASLIGFFSPGMLFAAQVGQWSPLFAGAFAIAPLGVFFIVKPHVGFAMFLARPTWWAASGAVACIAFAFVLQPTWLQDWRASLALAGAHVGDGSGKFPYTAPVMLPGGILVLAAFSRWRRPEARLLVALACVPQSLHLYEIVPLALVPLGWMQSMVYFAGGHLVWWVLLETRPWPWLPDYLLVSGTLYTLLVFLPLTAMVLRRPNEGDVPAWLERRIRDWPEWLRGGSSVAKV
jgi:hypothetical protein